MEPSAPPIVAANKPLPLEGALNVRDLGGYPLRSGGRTASGRFLRSDATGSLSEDDARKLLDMGLELVVDLRSSSEIESSPSKLQGTDKLRYLNVPLADRVQSSGFQGPLPASMAELYVSLLDEGRARMREVFVALAESEGLRLFNCTAGKDRTGVVAMLLLDLAGAEEEAIVADYAASEFNLAPALERQKAALLTRGIDVPDFVFESKPRDIRAAIGHLRSTYGSAETYLLSCGLPRSSIDRLREALAGERKAK
jgi:protein-tyrosine phosphatase